MNENNQNYNKQLKPVARKLRSEMTKSVLRFSDEEVLRDMRNVIREIECVVEDVEVCRSF